MTSVNYVHEIKVTKFLLHPYFFLILHFSKKKIETTRAIYSNSKRSEVFLVTKYFFNFFLEISQSSNNLEQL